MSLITKPVTFSNGGTIYAADHNSNNDTIYSDYNGNITNSNISASASITDSKLAQITTASKVSGTALTSLSSTPSGAGALPAVNGGTGLSTFVIGQVLAAASATTITGVGGGTTALFLQGQTGAAPIFSSVLSSILDYGTSTGTSTARNSTGIKIAYGTTTGLSGPGGTFTVTNLLFTSSSSYVVFTTQDDVQTAGSGSVQNVSGASFTITNAAVTAGSNQTHTYNWLAIGI